VRADPCPRRTDPAGLGYQPEDGSGVLLMRGHGGGSIAIRASTPQPSERERAYAELARRLAAALAALMTIREAVASATEAARAGAPR